MKQATIRPSQSPTYLPRPLAPDCVKAGFPSPAQDYEEETLDINEYLIRNGPATYFVQVEGDSMDGAGIHHGDILVVDRSITPQDGHIVIAFVEGERLVKRLRLFGQFGALEAANPKYPTIQLSAATQVEIWGVVTGKFAKVPV